MTAHDVQIAATEPQIGAVPEPAHGAEIVVPLNRLKASPRNARKVRHSAAAIEALAASIRAKGVLQAPVVEIERDREGAATGNYLVTIGEGRRQALRMLVKRKAIKRTHPVKVVVDTLGPYTSVFAIRRAMTEAKVRADDRRVGFVGLVTYEAEGGAVLRDLFTEDGGGWLEDPALLDRLVSEKLTVLAEDARQREGWKWAEACAEFADVADFGRVYPVAIERSEAEAAEMTALSEEYDRLISEADAVEVLPPETDARLEAIDKALQAYGPDYDYTPEAKSRAGVMVMLGHDGLARFERGLVRAEDAALAPPPPWDADEGADGEAPEYVEVDDARAGGEEEADEGLAPLSERLLIDLTAHKTMGLRDAVQADVVAALATVVHAMALQVIYPGYGDFTPLQLRLSAGGLERLAPGVGDSPAGRRVTDRLEAWGARLPERAEDLWEVLASMRRGDLLDLLACCTGVGLHAVRDPHDRRPGAWAQAETLATAVGLDMTGTWSATAASYFSRVPKARVLEAVTEAVGAGEAGRIAGFKKGDMADAAERLLEGRGWLPPVLRTAETLPEEPAQEGDGEYAPPPSLDEAYDVAAE